jgi:hypothetical protein
MFGEVNTVDDPFDHDQIRLDAIEVAAQMPRTTWR